MDKVLYPEGKGKNINGTKMDMIKKEILQDLDRDDLTPPLCWIMTRLPPSASPGPEAALMPDPGPGEVSATATAPLPAFPEFVEQSLGRLRSR